VYLLKWHGEGQLPYAALVRRSPHADSVVRKSKGWEVIIGLDYTIIIGYLAQVL
jgi:hypothetical protein